MKLFEVINTTWDNLQIATHKSVSFTLHMYWFVLCNLQIISGCVYHLEQLHAQSPFLFPIVFGINLIPFFDICSVLAVFHLTRVVRVCAPLLGPLRGRNCCCLWFSQVVLVFHCGVATSNLPSSPDPPDPLSNRRVLHGKSINTKNYWK